MLIEWVCVPGEVSTLSSGAESWERPPWPVSPSVGGLFERSTVSYVSPSVLSPSTGPHLSHQVWNRCSPGNCQFQALGTGCCGTEMCAGCVQGDQARGPPSATPASSLATSSSLHMAAEGPVKTPRLVSALLCSKPRQGTHLTRMSVEVLQRPTQPTLCPITS